MGESESGCDGRLMVWRFSCLVCMGCAGLARLPVWQRPHFARSMAVIHGEPQAAHTFLRFMSLSLGAGDSARGGAAAAGGGGGTAEAGAAGGGGPGGRPP